MNRRESRFSYQICEIQFWVKGVKEVKETTFRIMSLARQSYSTDKSFAMSGTTRWCRGKFAKEQRDIKIRPEMKSEDYIRDGKWKCWWDWRWNVKVRMRSEMESESEDEIRDGKWKWGREKKARIGSAKNKISFCQQKGCTAEADPIRSSN